MRDLFDELSCYAHTEKDRSLSTMTTLRIGGTARYVTYPDNDVELDSIMRFLKKNQIPFKMFGKGSDILASDDDYEGVIIRLDRHYDDAHFDENEISAQAGCSIIVLAVDAMKHGLSGLEFASGIPGTLGGCIYMNAGAYRSSMSEIISEVFVYRDGRLEWITNEECEFGYRTSIFQKHPDWIIVGARMILKPRDSHEIRDLMENRRNRRMQSQPLDMPSCGSVFRNPEGANAWELIEGIGYRGYQIGGALVSPKHCNFIVNAGGATAQDYYQLTEEIRLKVLDKYGVNLQREMEMFNWK